MESGNQNLMSMLLGGGTENGSQQNMEGFGQQYNTPVSGTMQPPLASPMGQQASPYHSQIMPQSPMMQQSDMMSPPYSQSQSSYNDTSFQGYPGYNMAASSMYSGYGQNGSFLSSLGSYSGQGRSMGQYTPTSSVGYGQQGYYTDLYSTVPPKSPASHQQIQQSSGYPTGLQGQMNVGGNGSSYPATGFSGQPSMSPLQKSMGQSFFPPRSPASQQINSPPNMAANYPGQTPTSPMAQPMVGHGPRRSSASPVSSMMQQGMPVYSMPQRQQYPTTTSVNAMAQNQSSCMFAQRLEKMSNQHQFQAQMTSSNMPVPTGSVASPSRRTSYPSQQGPLPGIHTIKSPSTGPVSPVQKSPPQIGKSPPPFKPMRSPPPYQAHKSPPTFQKSPSTMAPPYPPQGAVDTRKTGPPGNSPDVGQPPPKKPKKSVGGEKSSMQKLEEVAESVSPHLAEGLSHAVGNPVERKAGQAMPKPPDSSQSTETSPGKAGQAMPKPPDSSQSSETSPGEVENKNKTEKTSLNSVESSSMPKDVEMKDSKIENQNQMQQETPTVIAKNPNIEQNKTHSNDAKDDKTEKSKKDSKEAKSSDVPKEDKGKEVHKKDHKPKEDKEMKNDQSKEVINKEDKSKDSKGKDVINKEDKSKDSKGKDVINKEDKSKDLKGKDVTNKEHKIKELKRKEVSNKEAKTMELKGKEVESKEVANSDEKSKELKSKEVPNKQDQRKDLKGKEVTNKEVKNLDLKEELKNKEVISNEDNPKQPKLVEEKPKEKETKPENEKEETNVKPVRKTRAQFNMEWRERQRLIEQELNEILGENDQEDVPTARKKAVALVQDDRKSHHSATADSNKNKAPSSSKTRENASKDKVEDSARPANANPHVSNVDRSTGRTDTHKKFTASIKDSQSRTLVNKTNTKSPGTKVSISRSGHPPTIQATVIAKGQSAQSNQQVLVAKTAAGQMYLIQGNVLIPVQNITVQQPNGEKGNKVICVNQGQGKSSHVMVGNITPSLAHKPEKPKPKPKYNDDSDDELKSSNMEIDLACREKTLLSPTAELAENSESSKESRGSTSVNYSHSGHDIFKSRMAKSPGESSRFGFDSPNRPKSAIAASKASNLEKSLNAIKAKLELERSKHQESSDIDAKKRCGRPPGSRNKHSRKSYLYRREVDQRPQASNYSLHEKKDSVSEKEHTKPRSLNVPTVSKATRTSKRPKMVPPPQSPTRTLSVQPRGGVDGEDWVCSFCGKSSNHSSLGILYGPYKAKLSREKADSSRECMSPEKLVSPSCRPPELPEELEGKSIELWVHKDCSAWTQGLYMLGRTLFGLEQAVETAASHKCSKCNEPGATLQCFKRGCNSIFHFACARDSGCAFVEENFTIFCSVHKEKA